MSDHPRDPESSPGAPLDDGHTEEYPVVTQTLATPADASAWLAGDDDGGSDEEWVSQTTSGIRLGVPAALLLAIVLVAGGFWGGAALEKSHSGSSSGLAGVAARFRSAAAGIGASGTAGAAASRFAGLFGGTRAATGTVGTISVVSGNTLYVEDTATASIVKVTLTKSTTITRNANAAADDLRPGDTVTVQGATGSSGAVTATSVSATAPGVTSGFAGFGRGFGGAGAGGTGTGGTGTGGTSSNTTTTPALFGGG